MSVQRLSSFDQIFWMLAVLLMLGGHLAHAYDHSEAVSDCQCSHLGAEHKHSDSRGSDDSKDSTHCCHIHAPAVVGRLSSHVMIFPHLTDSRFLTKNDSLPDPPVQEIDYPPQLP